MSNTGDCLNCGSFSKSVFSCVEKGLVSKTVSTNAIPINYKKGQDIYKEGSAAKGVFCIQTGKVKIYKTCTNRNITLSLAANSDFLGYSGLFNGGTYINSARCLEDSQICFIPKKNFMNLMVSSPEMQTMLLKHSCQESNRLSNFIMDLKCKNMLNRVAGALFEINKKFGTDENKCLNISLTRKEISELSGTTTESVIRILNELKKEKTITFLNGRIKILDNSRLLASCSV